MATTPEGRVKAAVKALLSRYKVWHFSPVTGGYGVSGVLDIIACIGGRLLAIECKAAPGLHPTELQHACARAVFDAGGVAVLVHSANMSVLEELLAGLTHDSQARFDRNGLWPTPRVGGSGGRS